MCIPKNAFGHIKQFGELQFQLEIFQIQPLCQKLNKVTIHLAQYKSIFYHIQPH